MVARTMWSKEILTRCEDIHTHSLLPVPYIRWLSKCSKCIDILWLVPFENARETFRDTLLPTLVSEDGVKFPFLVVGQSLPYYQRCVTLVKSIISRGICLLFQLNLCWLSVSLPSASLCKYLTFVKLTRTFLYLRNMYWLSIKEGLY